MQSKLLVEDLSHLILSVNYKVLKIKQDIAVTIENKFKDNNVYFPSTHSPQNLNYFTVDNADLKIDTTDGKNQLHGTVIVAYQNESNHEQELNLVINRLSRRETKWPQGPVYKVTYCPPPNCLNISYKSYLPSHSNTTLELYCDDDTAWSI